MAVKYYKSVEITCHECDGKGKYEKWESYLSYYSGGSYPPGSGRSLGMRQCSRCKGHGKMIRKYYEDPPYKGRDDRFYTDFPKSDCYVVSATFGLNSRELMLVRARCKRAFLKNPFLMLGWCMYRFYGPIIASWSDRSPKFRNQAKRYLASPIVAATSTNARTSIPALTYLFLLSAVGILCLVPAVVISASISLTRRRS